MRSLQPAPRTNFVSTAARLSILSLLILLATVTQRSPQSARAQGRHVGANVVSWQTLQEAKHVPTAYGGRAESVAKLQSGAARPLAMASADFDSDGVDDLVIGFAHGGGGLLALHRGNLDAFAPQSHASWLGVAHEQFPPAFLPQASVIDIPEAPHFIVTGDFSGNGYVDILTGARGSSHLYLLMATGKGKFSQPQQITLPGALTALAAGQIGMHDGKADVAAAIHTQNGASVLVYKGKAGGLSGEAASYSLPEAATQLEIADLHGDGFADIAAVAGKEALIIHPTAAAGEDTTALVTPVPVGGSVRSIAVGSFVWERDGRNQIAVLLQSGIVQVLSTTAIDRRPLTAEEHFQRRWAAVHPQHNAGVSGAAREWSPGTEEWTVVKSGSVSSPISNNVRLMGVSLAHASPLDLMVVDSADTRLHVLPADTTGEGDTTELTVETGDSPVAVLAKRVNNDARPGLVLLGSSVSHPRTMAPLPDPTFTVNRFDDPPVSLGAASTYCSGGSNDCSLREAVLRANSDALSDTIDIPAGTITLTQIGTMENDGVTGDIDVKATVSIVGSVDGGGNPTTIVQGCGGSSGIACSSGTVWNDKFISTNKDGSTNGSLSISNIIFRNGNNTNTAPDPFFNFLGGAVDFFGCEPAEGGCGGLATASLTVTNSRFINNSANGCPGNACGGGLDAEGGPVTISNTLFSGNTAAGLGGGLMLVGSDVQFTITNSKFDNSTAANHAGGDGGAIYANIQDNTGSGTSTGNFALHNSTISGNTAVSEGGGIYFNFSANAGTGINQATGNIDQKTTISGNSAGSGGGIDFQGVSPDATKTTQNTSLTVTKSTFTGNQATNSAGLGGGGILLNGGGTLSMSFSRLHGNTTAASGKPTGLSLDGNAGVTANDNWWGCNAGPSTTPCDTAAVTGGGGTLTDTNWIVLTGTASPTKIKINQSSTVTGDFLHEHTGTISAGNLDVLIGLPITFNNPVLGTIPQAQPENIGAGGDATATYNAGGVGGNGSVDLTVDAQTDTVPIIVLQPPSIVKSFSPTTVAPNTASTVSFAITNGNTVAIDASFTDTLPTNLVVSPTPGVVDGCGSTVTATAGSGTISFNDNPALAVGTCTITVNVQSAVDNVYSNSVTIDSTDAGNGNTSTASLTVISPPAITKSFGATSIPLNGATSLSFQVNNPNTNETLNGISFTDTLPSGLVVATPNGLSGACGGTATATAGSGSVSLSGGTEAPGASCTISVNVKGTTAGDKANSVQVSSTNGGTGNTSQATLTVIGPPTVTQSASLSSTNLNGPDTLNFTITNPNAAAITLTGIGFNGTLSSGLVVNTTNNFNCGGTLTGTAGGHSYSLSGVTLAGTASCSLQVNVTGTAPGDQTSSTDAITSNEGGSGTTTSVTVNVVAPPSIAKVFVPSTIPVNGTSSLQFTITNPTGNTVSETGVAFQDTLPTGLTVADSTGTACSTGTLQTFAASHSIRLDGGTVAVGTPCTFNVTVTGAASGQYTNTTANVTSVNGGQGNTASASLTVATPPSITKSFGAASIPLNGTTSLSFSISNPNTGLGLSGVSFTDSLPAGTVVATPNGLTSTCGGTATAVAGSGTVSLSGGTLASTASCALSLNVQGTTAGVKNNSVTVSSTEGGTGSTSNASVTVVAPPTMTQAFGATSVPLNGTTTLTFNINNPNSASSLSGLHFQSVLFGVLTDVTPTPTNTCGGTLGITSGGTGVTLTGGTTTAGGSCAVSLTVTGNAAGTASSTVTTVDSTEGGSSTVPTASMFVVAPPSIAKAFVPSSITLNGTSSLNFTITNPAANTTSELGVAFSDTLPTGLTVASGTSTVCGGTLSTSSPTGIALSGATIATNGQCQFGVTVTGAASGSYTNTTGNVSSTNGGTGNTASAGLTVATPPSMTKAFGATSVPLNGTTSMTFNITNPNSALALSGVQFTDTLPSGLVVSSPTATNTCGGTAVAGSGGSTFSLSGGSIAAGGSCSVSTTVQGTSAGAKTNSATVSSSNAGTGNTPTASITVVAPPVASKSFGASSIPLNGSTSLSFTISNPNPSIDLTGINLNDLVQSLITFQPSTLSGSCGATPTATSSSLSLSGGSIAAGGNCTFSINVTGVAAGTVSNTTSAVTSTQGGTGNSASAGLFVVAPPVIAKAFTPSLITLNGTTSLGFTISNPTANTVAEAGVAFTDVLPSGLTVTNGTGTACGGTFITSGGNTISLSGATIGVGSQCTPSVTVTGTAPGAFTNVTGNVTSTNGGTGNTATAGLQVGDFQLSLSPKTETVPPGHMGVYTLTITSTGFTGLVDFTCGGGPTGSTCKVIPNSVNITSASTTAKVTIDFAVPKGASKGTSTITVTGVGGGLTRTATAKLTVGLNQ